MAEFKLKEYSCPTGSRIFCGGWIQMCCPLLFQAPYLEKYDNRKDTRLGSTSTYINSKFFLSIESA